MQRVATMNDGCKLHYRYHLNSDKPTLVLSNSLGTTMDMWQPQLNEFKKHFSVLCYDSRGHGRSDVTLGAYSMDRLGNDVIDLLDHLSLEKIFYCGLSIGGMVGQWLTTFYPQRINALVMANTSALIAPASMWQDRLTLVLNSGLPLIWPNVLTRWLSQGFSDKETEQVAFLKAMFNSIDATGYAGCCAAIRDMDMRNLARLNRLPTLLIAGAQDLATPVVDSEYLLSQYDNAELVELNAGHLSNIEQPEEFTANVLRFLLAQE